MESVIDDPQFEEVLLEMEDDIVWENRFSQDLPERPNNPSRWLVAQYAESGAPDTENIRAYVPWGGLVPWSKTKASAGYGSEQIRLNVVYLERPTSRTVRDPMSIANTLVHESAHTFGQVHGDSQSASENICDAAYVAGDLAEALLRYRASGSAIGAEDFSAPICERLQARLRERGVMR